MANEIQVTGGWTHTNGYKSLGPRSFTLDQEGDFLGPFPGAVSVPLTGYDVVIPTGVVPGMIEIWNQDATNYVEYGVYEPANNVFYPVGEVGPGKSYRWYMSRNFGEEWTSIGTGTGTSGENNRLRFRPNGAAVNCFIGIFAR